jgi:hypothetical protein
MNMSRRGGGLKPPSSFECVSNANVERRPHFYYSLAPAVMQGIWSIIARVAWFLRVARSGNGPAGSDFTSPRCSLRHSSTRSGFTSSSSSCQRAMLVLSVHTPELIKTARYLGTLDSGLAHGVIAHIIPFSASYTYGFSFCTYRPDVVFSRIAFTPPFISYRIGILPHSIHAEGPILRGFVISYAIVVFIYEPVCDGPLHGSSPRLVAWQLVS